MKPNQKSMADKAALPSTFHKNIYHDFPSLENGDETNDSKHIGEENISEDGANSSKPSTSRAHVAPDEVIGHNQIDSTFEPVYYEEQQHEELTEECGISSIVRAKLCNRF
ncbi:hypothetical protein K1T71_002675 [Dendrolimus kikuchii]|uniref:Uncharacterized protein n=1 Tax=Dendrolimus kikuchii TaxID=765133 RepID=A0ACC1DDC7_9NEOP|nr:hypothetical protein K1T71_002675 [Dendrolimus kikuchii]